MSHLSKEIGIWFVYDGECPLCTKAATALRIKQQYGILHLLNARENIGHNLLLAITEQGLDLDEGMVIYDGEHFYHGESALRFMAKYSAPRGILNLFNKSLFWSDRLSKTIYPWLRGIRNLLLKNRNVSRIDNLNFKSEPTFKSIFGDTWKHLPLVIQKHYSIRPYSDDITTAVGTLDIMCTGPIKYFSTLFWLMGSIPPHNEKDVPVTVHFKSDQHTKYFHFVRTFYFKNRKTYQFRSRMIQTTENEVIEIMRFGFGWKMQYLWEDSRVKLKHKGYVLKIFGHFVPLPLTVLMGEGNAEETVIDDHNFKMFTDITHPKWGKIYEYKGCFEIKNNVIKDKE